MFLNEIVGEVTKLIEETFPKGINVVTDFEKDSPFLLADGAQIHQVLLNLCVNARDAMPDGGTITISTSTVAGQLVASKFANASSKEYALFKVTDTGTGIDEVTKRQIFDPFFTTKEVGKGTGLGLALVHSIVTNHGGFIDVASRKRKGTTFSIYLPAMERKTQHDGTAVKSLQSVRGGTETILLIEDENLLRELVKDVVESRGYKVLTAEDGEEGVEIFTRRRSEIAVVISDLGLPKIPGDEVLKKIRAS